MQANERPICLSIGTSDSSGGAGIQADLKTFTALGCYAATVVVAATAQNFSGIREMHLVPDAFVRAQLEAVSDELPIAAVKIGLCSSVGTIRVIGRWLRERRDLRVVIDPVTADSRGIPLLQPEAIDALRSELLPLATMITPNRFQAALLIGWDECLGQESMEEAARTLFVEYGCPTVVSGGLDGDCRDVFVGIDGLRHFEGHSQPRDSVHGRGSTFSAAIAAGLAKGDSQRESILNAKLYLAAAIQAGPVLANGRRLLWHGVAMDEPATTTLRRQV